MPVPRPDQIAQRQQQLDDVRDTLHQVLFDGKLLALVTKHVRDPARVADFATNLEYYKFLVDKWDQAPAQRVQQDEAESLHFEVAKRCYQSTLDSLRKVTKEARDRAKAAAKGRTPKLLDQVSNGFKSIQSQEKALREARVAAGTDIANWVRAQVNLTNQADHFVETRGLGAVVFMQYVRDDTAKLPTPDMETWHAQQALLARYSREANCSEVVSLGLTRAHLTLPGELLTYKALDVTDPDRPDNRPNHSVLFLGDPDRPESVAVDAWTRIPTVTGTFNYSWPEVHQARSLYQRPALGRDLLPDAGRYVDREWLRLHPPPGDLRNPPADRREAAGYRGAENVYAIDHAFYDRADDPRWGTALSPAAMLVPVARHPDFVADPAMLVGAPQQATDASFGSSASVAQVAVSAPYVLSVYPDQTASTGGGYASPPREVPHHRPAGGRRH